LSQSWTSNSRHPKALFAGQSTLTTFISVLTFPTVKLVKLFWENPGTRKEQMILPFHGLHDLEFILFAVHQPESAGLWDSPCSHSALLCRLFELRSEAQEPCGVHMAHNSDGLCDSLLRIDSCLENTSILQEILVYASAPIWNRCCRRFQTMHWGSLRLQKQRKTTQFRKAHWSQFMITMLRGATRSKWNIRHLSCPRHLLS
jgi:hypothetical protein